MSVGVVTAIAGGARYALAIDGVAGHAGTVPMEVRQDALMAAAEIALFVERRVRAEPGLVGTVGRFSVPEGAINVIPKRCELSLDIRSQDDAAASRALADVLAEAQSIAGRRGVRALCAAPPAIVCGQHRASRPSGKAACQRRRPRRSHVRRCH
jgi:acetylornithine deacetylase/succinyl-diaminopimelate desuccinylase-like protein